MLETSQCPVCACKLSFGFELHTASLDTKVLRCPECRSLTKSPFWGPEELAKIYEHYGQHEQHYEITAGEHDNIAARLSRIEKFHKKRGRLLEIGCGCGYFLEDAAKQGWEVQGIEIGGSAEANLLESVRGKVDFVTGEKDYEKAIKKQVYDVVCSYQVLEHLMNPVASFDAWAGGLKPGGLMVVQTPNAESLGARFNRDVWFHLQVPEHFTIYSKKAVEKMFTRNGIRKTGAFYGGTPFFATRASKGGEKKSSAMTFYRYRRLTKIVRDWVYRLGIGDNLEIYGKKT